MNHLMNRFSPGATTQIRMDHTHALTTFHKYHIDTSPGRKRAIVETLSLALDIHATLEEEISTPQCAASTPTSSTGAFPNTAR